MNKCGGCGKFLSNTNSVRCSKCHGKFHKDCVNIPESAGVKVTWICPGCKVKLPREDNSATPVKGLDSDYVSLTGTGVSEIPVLSLENTQTCTPQDDTLNLASEIRSIRNEISALRAEVRDYRNEVSGFKTQLESHGQSITNIETRISVLEEKFEKAVPSNLDPLEDTIAELKCQINERDQELLLNDVEIAGVPERKGESVIHLVKLLSNKLGVQLEETDIVHAERVGSTLRNRSETVNSDSSPSAEPTTHRPRYISVRFARRTTREQVLRAARVRRDLTSADLEVKGTASRIYINERLTRTNRQLFYRARQAGTLHKWRYVWTKEGKILARKEDGRKAERIRCEKDLDKVFL